MALEFSDPDLRENKQLQCFPQKIQESSHFSLAVYQKYDGYCHTGIAIFFDHQPYATVDVHVSTEKRQKMMKAGVSQTQTAKDEVVLTNVKVQFVNSLEDWSVMNFYQSGVENGAEMEGGNEQKRKKRKKERKKKFLDIIEEIFLLDPGPYNVLTNNCRTHCFDVIRRIKKYLYPSRHWQVSVFLYSVRIMDWRMCYRLICKHVCKLDRYIFHIFFLLSVIYSIVALNLEVAILQVSTITLAFALVFTLVATGMNGGALYERMSSEVEWKMTIRRRPKKKSRILHFTGQ